ncbi:fumarylacetoacetate hydrolase family protein [Bradyrhizobium sp. 169]|uniref:fumarylacetoacetate hydrolase family protein n=1 Tax=Bradyrhizobium sp. 169 TaxID=2782640 RepID=UPI001FF7982A|nr:fumarylacetoacetate hydrolase family protein [Bradyrhizobium sp. 169]MCK1589091.1 fumarylacetoacetate hydrolase family protein [Bradyrhizobium sp. 169]
MKLVRFGEFGQEKPGLIDNDGNIRDLSSVIADVDGSTIGPESLAALAILDPACLPIAPAGVRIGACVNRVSNFIAVGLNYADHAAESGMAVPSEPVLFNKAPSCIVGPHDDVLIPPSSKKTDWEVEVAIVIGKRASYVSQVDAPDHIAGYCVCNDVSESSYQLERGGTWTKGKGCPTFGPLGPWLVTKDEVDIDNLSMTLSVDGELVQNGSTKTMIFRAPFIVHYISQFLILMPGDVITTGTPPGVGMGFKPPRFLKGGEVIEVSIQGLGTQRQNVRAA